MGKEVWTDGSAMSHSTRTRSVAEAACRLSVGGKWGRKGGVDGVARVAALHSPGDKLPFPLSAVDLLL